VVLIPTQDAADTLGSLESLQARTLADAYRWAWPTWLFWAAVYFSSVLVLLTAPDWAIGLYWLCTIPIAIAVTTVVMRRLPRRAGVVPPHGRRLVVGSLAVALVALGTAWITPLGWAFAVSFGIVALGWIWPRRLAIAIGGGLAGAAVVLVLLLPEPEATAAIACLYATAFVGYAFFERARLQALR
jgi:hypothetical protein